MSDAHPREGVHRQFITVGARTLEYSSPQAHVRYVVQVAGNLPLAPRSLLVDVKNDALAIRDRQGIVLWLEVGEHLFPRLDSGLFPRGADLVEEGRALVDLEAAVDYVQTWVDSEVTVTRLRQGAVSIEDDHGGVTVAVADPNTGFIVSLTRRTPENTEIVMTASRCLESAAPEVAFSMASLP